MSIAQIAELFFQVFLVGVRVAVQAQQVDVEVRRLVCHVLLERRPVSILVSVQEDIRAVILVVTAGCVSVLSER